MTTYWLSAAVASRSRRRHCESSLGRRQIRNQEYLVQERERYQVEGRPIWGGALVIRPPTIRVQGAVSGGEVGEVTLHGAFN